MTYFVDIIVYDRLFKDLTHSLYILNEHKSYPKLCDLKKCRMTVSLP